jgi:hypothetical protein
MRAGVPPGVGSASFRASPLSTAHAAVIASKLVLLRSLGVVRPARVRRFGGGGGTGAQSWSGVPARPVAYASLVASAYPQRVASEYQSPRRSIGPALADLRRAAAAKTCARMAARLAAL